MDFALKHLYCFSNIREVIVSILVLMDFALKPIAPSSRTASMYVSILVLMDFALKRGFFGGKPL